MEEKDLKRKIHDLGKFIADNQPYVIDIDICKDDNPKHNYWEVGMKTKYNDKDVEILACLNTTEYTKVVSDVGSDLVIEHRSICSLLIRDIK